nr:nucleobase-ascorbate transporter 8-like [Arachis hypogaea]
MGGENKEKARVIQTLQFVAGINTFFQTFFGTHLPAVIGGSYHFVPTTISIILAARYSDIVNPQEVRFVFKIKMLPNIRVQLINGLADIEASPSAFVIPLTKYYKAVFLFSFSEFVRWKNSQWRNLQVGWDESTAENWDF